MKSDAAEGCRDDAQTIITDICIYVSRRYCKMLTAKKTVSFALDAGRKSLKTQFFVSSSPGTEIYFCVEIKDVAS